MNNRSFSSPVLLLFFFPWLYGFMEKYRLWNIVLLIIPVRLQSVLYRLKITVTVCCVSRKTFHIKKLCKVSRTGDWPRYQWDTGCTRERDTRRTGINNAPRRGNVFLWTWKVDFFRSDNHQLRELLRRSDSLKLQETFKKKKNLRRFHLIWSFLKIELKILILR